MSLPAAILGFLRLEPTTGYTLRQRFEGSVGSFWSITQSQIYRELHRLECDGFVAARREPSQIGPERKIYALTREGHAALEAWLREPLEPLQLRHPLLLKLVLASELPHPELDRVLATYRDAMAATREEHRRRLGAEEVFSLARSHREATLWRLAIEHGIAWCDAEIAWIERARATLLGPDAAPGGGPPERGRPRRKARTR